MTKARFEAETDALCGSQAPTALVVGSGTYEQAAIARQLQKAGLKVVLLQHFAAEPYIPSASGGILRGLATLLPNILYLPGTVHHIARGRCHGGWRVYLSSLQDPQLPELFELPVDMLAVCCGTTTCSPAASGGQVDAQIMLQPGVLDNAADKKAKPLSSLVKAVRAVWQGSLPASQEGGSAELSAAAVAALAPALPWQGWFDAEVLARLQVSHEHGMLLYRGLLPPVINNLALLAALPPSACTNELLELQASWLSCVWSDSLRLPSAAAMLQEAKTLRKRTASGQSLKAAKASGKHHARMLGADLQAVAKARTAPLTSSFKALLTRCFTSATRDRTLPGQGHPHSASPTPVLHHATSSSPVAAPNTSATQPNTTPQLELLSYRTSKPVVHLSPPQSPRARSSCSTRPSHEQATSGTIAISPAPGRKQAGIACRPGHSSSSVDEPVTLGSMTDPQLTVTGSQHSMCQPLAACHSSVTCVDGSSQRRGSLDRSLGLGHQHKKQTNPGMPQRTMLYGDRRTPSDAAAHPKWRRSDEYQVQQAHPLPAHTNLHRDFTGPSKAVLAVACEQRLQRGQRIPCHPEAAQGAHRRHSDSCDTAFAYVQDLQHSPNAAASLGVKRKPRLPHCLSAPHSLGSRVNRDLPFSPAPAGVELPASPSNQAVDVPVSSPIGSTAVNPVFSKHMGNCSVPSGSQAISSVSVSGVETTCTSKSCASSELVTKPHVAASCHQLPSSVLQLQSTSCRSESMPQQLLKELHSQPCSHTAAFRRYDVPGMQAGAADHIWQPPHHYEDSQRPSNYSSSAAHTQIDSQVLSTLSESTRTSNSSNIVAPLSSTGLRAPTPIRVVSPAPLQPSSPAVATNMILPLHLKAPITISPVQTPMHVSPGPASPFRPDSRTAGSSVPQLPSSMSDCDCSSRTLRMGSDRMTGSSLMVLSDLLDEELVALEDPEADMYGNAADARTHSKQGPSIPLSPHRGVHVSIHKPAPARGLHGSRAPRPSTSGQSPVHPRLERKPTQSWPQVPLPHHSHQHAKGGSASNMHANATAVMPSAGYGATAGEQYKQRVNEYSARVTSGHMFQLSLDRTVQAVSTQLAADQLKRAPRLHAVTKYDRSSSSSQAETPQSAYMLRHAGPSPFAYPPAAMGRSHSACNAPLDCTHTYTQQARRHSVSLDLVAQYAAHDDSTTMQSPTVPATYGTQAAAAQHSPTRPVSDTPMHRVWPWGRAAQPPSGPASTPANGAWAVRHSPSAASHDQLVLGANNGIPYTADSRSSWNTPTAAIAPASSPSLMLPLTVGRRASNVSLVSTGTDSSGATPMAVRPTAVSDYQQPYGSAAGGQDPAHSQRLTYPPTHKTPGLRTSASSPMYAHGSSTNSPMLAHGGQSWQDCLQGLQADVMHGHGPAGLSRAGGRWHLHIPRRGSSWGPRSFHSRAVADAHGWTSRQSGAAERPAPIRLSLDVPASRHGFTRFHSDANMWAGAQTAAASVDN